MTEMTQEMTTEKPQLTVDTDSGRKKKLLFGVLASIILTCIIFAAIEIRYPFFFSTDDNADWYASEYANVIRVILSGKFPLYNFTQFCGQRFFANGQSGVLNPVMYIAAILSKLFFGDLHAIIEFLALLMMIMGAWGAYLLLERLGACQAAAIAGAIAWNFNAYNIWVGCSWILVILTTGVLPFILYGSVRLCDKQCFGNYLWAILPKVFLFYIGHPQFFFYAAVFDGLFALSYVFFNSPGKRIKSLFVLIGRYVIIYIAVVILILPQLIPQYQMISMTSQGETLLFKDFNRESDALVIGFIWPFMYSTVFNRAIDPFFGYPLLICGMAGIPIPLLVFTSERKRLLKHKRILLNMLVAVPAIIVAFLSAYSTAFKHLLYVIPIINRFHYLHRNIPYLSDLMVIFAAMSFTLLRNILSDGKKKTGKQNKNFARAAGIAFVLLEAVNMTLVFVCQPRWSRGPIYNIEQGYNEEYASRVKNGRYLCVGYEFFVRRDGKIVQDLAHSLRYNLASYYGINNVSGYYSVYTNVELGKNRLFFKNILNYSGDLRYPYSGIIKEMRSQSVCWYIVNPKNRDRFESILTVMGMEKVYEDEYGIFYYDSECEPLAFDEQGRKVDLKQSEVNNLKLNTDESFEGGTITLNYSLIPISAATSTAKRRR